MQIYSSSYSLRFLIHPSRTLAQRSCTKLPGHCTAVRLQCSVCLYYRPYHARIKVTCTGWAGLKAASGTQVRALQGTPVQSSAHQCTPVHGTTQHCTALVQVGKRYSKKSLEFIDYIFWLCLYVHFSSYSWDGKLGVAVKVNLIRSQVGSKNASLYWIH